MSRGPLSLLLCLLVTLAVACAAMLGIKPPGEKPFEHRAHVLNGVHCFDCHRGAQEAGERGPMHFPDTADCVRCHEKPHNPATCSNCHGSHELRGRALAAREHLKFEHPKHVDAAQGNCIKCHLEVGSNDGPLRPTMASCFSCHRHEQQWQITDCDGCHVDLEAERTLPESHVVHGPDWLREHGLRAASEQQLCVACHSERSCAACHGVTVPATPTRLRFDQPERMDMHRAGFRSRHALEARSDPALCVTCHSESSCRNCHTREGVVGNGARSPHPPGWVGARSGDNAHGPAARMDPVGCASCHGGAGEQLCVGCHRVGGPGGNPHPPGFSSDRPLSELPCRMCHGGVL